MSYGSILELIGKTPLVELSRLSCKLQLNIKLYGKVEAFNPSGSSKDRAAYNMLLCAMQQGKLQKGSTVITATSGNTGVALAMACAVMGISLIVTMPENMSAERIKLLKAYGASVVLTSAAEGMTGAVERANELSKQLSNSIILDQFTDMANPKAHEETTAREIIADLGYPDAFIAAIGTGGTISGTGKVLKEGGTRIIGVEPLESPLLTKGQAGSHGIMGIGANFVPATLNLNVIDEILTVSTEQAKNTMLLLARTEGIFCGISSGAAVAAAVELSKRAEFREKTVVALLPDTGERYLSTL
ncbi:MAG: cysteine synthase A [Clostridia bacterium]|nr:cysteine synthase A [Clostridia bacterium]